MAIWLALSPDLGLSSTILQAFSEATGLALPSSLRLTDDCKQGPALLSGPKQRRELHPGGHTRSPAKPNAAMASRSSQLSQPAAHSFPPLELHTQQWQWPSRVAELEVRSMEACSLKEADWNDLPALPMERIMHKVEVEGGAGASVMQAVSKSWRAA